MKAFGRRSGALQAHFFSQLDRRLEAQRAECTDVIRLDTGSPDMPPAPAIIHALQVSAEGGQSHGYTSHRGPGTLREAWATAYSRLYDVHLDAEAEVLPLMGSKEGIFHLTQIAVGAGDVVLVPDPGYPTYAAAAHFAGAEVYAMPLEADAGFLPDLEAVPPEIVRRAKLLWLNYPNNPTGATASLAFFQSAVAFAHKHGLLLCHDAAYALITFDGCRPPSLLEVPGAAGCSVEFNTLSKSHNMAGWRTGVVVGHREALARLLALKSNADSGHFLPILEAATAALNGDQAWLIQRNAVYQERRDRVLSSLVAMGWPAQPPKASLYVWCAVPAGWTSAAFAERLLLQAKVSLTPGIVFGPKGEGYVRISLTAPTERVAEAMARLEDWWASEPRSVVSTQAG